MQKINILNSKEVKKFREIVLKDFGVFSEGDYAFLINENGRVFIVNKEIDQIDLTKLRIDKMGLYFAEYKNTQVRLSKEGAAFLAQFGKLKHLLELSSEEVERYFQGEELKKDLGEDGKWLILSFEKNILGCAKYKDGVILNFLPKIHRGTVIV